MWPSSSPGRCSSVSGCSAAAAAAAESLSGGEAGEAMALAERAVELAPQCREAAKGPEVARAGGRGRTRRLCNQRDAGWAGRNEQDVK